MREMVIDAIRITFPPSFNFGLLPARSSVKLNVISVYALSFESIAPGVTIHRDYALGRLSNRVSDTQDLRFFHAKIAAHDHQPIVFKRRAPER